VSARPIRALLMTIDSYQWVLLDINVALPDSPTGIRINNKVALCPGSKDPCKRPVTGHRAPGLTSVRYDNADNQLGQLRQPLAPVAVQKNGKRSTFAPNTFGR